VEVTLACPGKGELARRARLEKIPLHEINIRGEWDAVSAWRLGALAKDFDILHAHTSHTHSLAVFAARIGAARPVVVHRRVDFKPGGGPLSRWKYRSPDRYVAISDAVAEVLRAAGIPDRKIKIVPSGTDPEEVEKVPPSDIRAELGLGNETPLAGNIAQLVDHKGQRFLVDAAPRLFEEIPEAHIVIAGSGEMEERLKRQIRRLGLEDRVHLLGWRNDPYGLLKSFDLFVMSSHMEGMGSVILDAFAAKTPVVTTSAGGLGNVVKDGETGRVVPPGDPESLAKAMAEAIRDRRKSAEMVENAYNLLHQKYTYQKMVEGVMEVYREVLH